MLNVAFLAETCVGLSTTTFPSEMVSLRPYDASRTTHHVLGLGGQVLGVRGKALGLDPFSLVRLASLC